MKKGLHLHRVLFLFFLFFAVGLFFDFSSTLYAWFIRTSLAYPTLGELSLMLWLISISYIFLYTLKEFDQDRLKPGILLLFFILIFGEGIHLVSNSVQIKLWIIGYKDSLALGLPIHPKLAAVSPPLRQVFHYLYICDEYIGHFFIFSAIFLFLALFYSLGFNHEKPKKPKIIDVILMLSVAAINGIYMAWNVIEGQSVYLLLLFCLLMLGIKLYQTYHRR